MTSLDEPMRFSNEFDWDIGREEVAQETLELYDVRAAKKIIVDNPRQVVSLDLLKYGNQVRDYLSDVCLKPDVDWDLIDVTMPIIFGRETNDSRFPIDGRHRLEKAMKLECQSVPAVYLTAEETRSIRLA